MKPAASPPSRALAYAVASAALLLGVLQAALAALSLVIDQPLADAARAGDERAVNALALPLELLTYLALAGWVGTLVITGIWLLRLRRFSERVNPWFQHSRRRWWAFGGWVVPVVSLWFPYQYVRDLRDSLRPQSQEGPLLRWWWGAVLSALLVNRVVGSGEADLASLEDMGRDTTIGAVAVWVALPLWLAVVRRLATALDEVPPEVLHRTAHDPDPDAYDHREVPSGAPLYGPGSLPPAVTPPPTAPPSGHSP